MSGTIGTMLVLMILLLIVALIIRGIIRDKKAGRSVICGVDCKSCGGCAAHGNMNMEYTEHNGSDTASGSTRASVGGIRASGSTRASVGGIREVNSGACASCSSSCAYHSRCPRCKS